MKICEHCNGYLDIPSQMCSECWKEFSQLGCSEELSPKVEEKKLFVGSGEDVCLSSQ